MAFRMPELCQETTETSGVTGAGNHYVLEGAVQGRRAIQAGLANNDTSFFVVSDGATPPNFEVFLGTYVETTNSVRPDTLIDSSLGGSPVNWPGSGIRDIWITPIEEPIVPLIDPAWVDGFMVRNSQYSLAARSLALAGSADFLVLTNANGTGGNPTFTQQYPPLRRSSGATLDQRTMVEELVLAAASTKFSSASHEVRGSDDTVGLKVTRNGATDYLVEGGIGGSLKRLLNTDDAGTLVNVFDGATSNSGAVSTIQSDTEIQITVPAAGSYVLVVYGLVHFSASPTSTGGTLLVEESVGDAVSWVDFAESRTTIDAATTIGVELLYFRLAPTNSEDYFYRLTPSATGGASLSCSAPRRHTIMAILLKV